MFLKDTFTVPKNGLDVSQMIILLENVILIWKKNIKKVIKKNNCELRSGILKKLENLQSSGPSKFWELVSELNVKHKAGEEIGLDTWSQYFMNLHSKETSSNKTVHKWIPKSNYWETRQTTPI